MKKALLTSLVLAAVSSATAAGQFYVGVGTSVIGSGTQTWSNDVNSREPEFDYDYSNVAFDLGYQFDSENRVELSINSFDIEYDDNLQDETFSGFDIDYKFVFPQDKFKPFIGVGLGFYNWEDSADQFVDDEDRSAMSFNLGAGLVYQVHKHVDVELAYNYKYMQWQDLEVYNGYNYATVETDDRLSGIDAAVHVLF